MDGLANEIIGGWKVKHRLEFMASMGGATLFSGGSNEPPDFQKNIYLYIKKYFFVSLIL